MKFKTLFSLLLWLIFPLQAYEITGKVIKVSDGDTVTIMSADYNKHTIRLYGIDAPEKGQPYGKKSKQLLAKLVARQTVMADCIEKDKYHRDVCTIIKDGNDINAAMVTHGGAWVYREYYRGTAYYDGERQAQSQQRGLWKTSEAQTIAPWNWRKGENNDVNAPPVKLSRNNICHQKGTKYYNHVTRYQRFDTIQRCLQNGRLPRG